MSLACRDIRLSLGVYVLGAIDPADRAIVDIHLTHCPDCREELAGLAGLPALLGRVPARDAERLAVDGADLADLEEPSPALLSSLLDQVAARRKARRWRALTAVAAAAVIAVGAGVAAGIAMSGRAPQHIAAGDWPEQVQAISLHTHVDAAVTYAPAVSGTTMEVRVSGVKDGTVCTFWVLGANGKNVRVSAWTVIPGHENAWYLAWSPTSAASLRGFDITAGGKLLVQVPAT